MTASDRAPVEEVPISGLAAALAPLGLVVEALVDGPTDHGSEERWRLRVGPPSQEVVVARLRPELAREEAVRRRYVRDIERLRALDVSSLAPVLATGPLPDPRDPQAEPPWRIRAEPVGETLARFIEHRAPAPLEEVVAIGAALADALYALHRAGAVLRDLDPRAIVRLADGRIVFTDVGLARVDVLSSHTASSMMVHASPYAAPEQLLRTILDQRSDIYGLGVILWWCLTGVSPFGDEPTLFRARTPLVPLSRLRPDLPPVIDHLLRRCLAERPDDRPESVAEVAWVLRGGAGERGWTVERTACQACEAPLRIGQRLCLNCGKLGVQFRHAPTDRNRRALDLLSLNEDASTLATLRTVLETVAHEPVHREFLIGDANMYSEHERASRQRLPARLFNDLDPDTARTLHERMAAEGLDVALVDRRRYPRILVAGLLAFVGTAVVLGGGWSLGIVWWLLLILTAAGGLGSVVLLSRAMTALNAQNTPSLYRLRAAPAALPASDPLVARLAALLDDDTPGDVRAQVGELALIVQRLVDHRAHLLDVGQTEVAELDMLTEPIRPLISKIESLVEKLVRASKELADLDEGAMVRGIAAADARGETTRREELLLGLDRLRTLEEDRARQFHHLLEASNLLRRAADLGMEVRDPKAAYDRQVQLALATLE